jgi:hypothetical protein
MRLSPVQLRGQEPKPEITTNGWISFRVKTPSESVLGLGRKKRSAGLQPRLVRVPKRPGDIV